MGGPNALVFHISRMVVVPVLFQFTGRGGTRTRDSGVVIADLDTLERLMLLKHQDLIMKRIPSGPKPS